MMVAKLSLIVQGYSTERGRTKNARRVDCGLRFMLMLLDEVEQKLAVEVGS